MSNGMVFILHAVADEKYAVALAAALAPVTAIPTVLAENGARGVQLGGGSASLVIWTKNTGACAETALTALPHGSAAVCVANGATAPEALRVRALRMAEISGDAGRDAEALRETIALLHTQLRARNLDNSRRRGSVAPRLASAGAPAGEAAAARKSPMVMRSAVGLGATLAVVGVIVPNITNRALATDVADASTMEANSAAAPSVLPAVPQAEIEVADSEANADDPLMMLTAYNEPAAPLPTPQLFQAYAPRSIAFVTAREAATPLASLSEIDAVLGETVATALRASKKGPTQTASVVAPERNNATASVVDQAFGE